MNKIKINMLSMADQVGGQGVGSAYLELLNLLKKKGKKDFEIVVNKGTKYDILHAHTVEPRNLFKMLLTKGKTVCYVHFLPNTLDGSIHLPKPIFAIFKKYVLYFYKKADYLVVVNPSFKKEMISLGLKEEKIFYIPNFVSTKNFYPKKQDKEKLRKKLNLPEKAFIILGAGQVQTRKGVLDFIEIAKKRKDDLFLWAGGFSFGNITDGYEELKKVMENPPENVRFLGIIPRNEMNDLYNAVDLLLVPSYNELFPMTILETASTNTPFVLRDLELYEEILFNKYPKAHDNKDFIEAIDTLKKNPKEYQKQVEYTKEIASYYSEDAIYKKWKKFYTDVVNDKK